MSLRSAPDPEVAGAHLQLDTLERDGQIAVLGEEAHAAQPNPRLRRPRPRGEPSKLG